MAKKKESRQKKMNVRVDFTPMVDMMMLLITFFMLCTSLSKPQTMELSMPSNDKNIQDEDRNAAKASQTITVYVTGDDKIFYVEGLPNYEDPNCLKETGWGKEGFRKVLINHHTEDGSTPVQDVMKAKIALDEKKLKDPDKYPEEVYNKQLAEIKAGKIDGQKVPVLTVIIKPTDKSVYKNLIDVLDEMQICSISKYVIDKINDNDEKLLTAKGLK